MDDERLLDKKNRNIITNSIKILENNIDRYEKYDKNIKKKILYQSLEMNEYYMIRNLISCNILSYDKLYIEIKNDKIYCLTLDEYKYRKIEFIKQNINNLNKIEYYVGIKMEPGWIGCGMSYKVLINNFKNSNKNNITICEDDCKLPENFNDIYNKIIKYLEKQNYDIFVGVIADFDKNTKISKIEEVDGIMYIHINKFTSTVFNIYSRNICDTIIKWDHNNMDIINNTIDRYLQNIDLKIITTYPYYFDCINVQSTLWNVTFYDKMFFNSLKLLKQKIDLFFKNNK